MNSFIDCYKKMMKNYANFNGRTSRADFWKAFLVYFIMNMIVGIPSFIVSFISLMPYQKKVLKITKKQHFQIIGLYF